MSAATPTSESSELPVPPTSSIQISSFTEHGSSSAKPTILHLGDDIRWNQELYTEMQEKFNIVRTYSMGRAEFTTALREKKWGAFVGMYRPFWNTGGEMGNWDIELISLLPPSCKIYASAGAGFDWVDTRALAAHGTIYCNSASACTESVADTAIVLILSCYRAIPWSFLAARSCDPAQFADANQNIAAVTHNPNGSVLGIVGLGRIGLCIAEKATRAFDMRIKYFDLVRMPEREASVGAEWCESLDELVSTSDCVVLATPFDGEVLLSSAQFSKFRRGCRLVNIARGKLVDEEALVRALDDGIVSAAGLDVHADEPRVNENLALRRNVMVLSHTAGASVESHVGFERLGMENLLGWLEKGVEGVVSPVNLQWLRK